MGVESGNPPWENKPSTETPITAQALNAIEAAIDRGANNTATLEELVETGRLSPGVLESTFATDGRMDVIEALVNSGRLSDAQLNAEFASDDRMDTIENLINTGRLSTTQLDAAYTSDARGDALEAAIAGLPSTYLKINSATRYLDAAPLEDITVKLQALLDETPKNYSSIAIMPGTYWISDTVTIDISRTGIVGLFNGVKFRPSATFIQDGRPMFKIIRTTGDGPVPGNSVSRVPNNNIMSNVSIISGYGSSTTYANIVAVQMGNDISNTGRPHASFTFTSVYVVGFEVGFQIGNNTYNIGWNNCVFGYCNKSIYHPSDVTDSGSRMVLVNTTFYGCYQGVCCTSNQGRYQFIGCGFDGVTQPLLIHGRWAEFYTCHVEPGTRSASGVPLVQINGGSFNWIGGDLGLSARTGETANDPILIFNNEDKGARAMIRDVFVTGALQSAVSYFAGGTGLVTMENVQGGAGQYMRGSSPLANLLANGDAERSASILDTVYIQGGSGTITDAAGVYEDDTMRFEITTEHKKSGTRSYKFTKKTSAGSYIYLLTPVEGGKIYQHSAYISRLASLNNQVNVSYGYGKLRNGVITGIVTTVTRNISDSSMAVGEWTTLDDNQANRIPAWADVIFMRISKSTSGAPVYIDEMWRGTL